MDTQAMLLLMAFTMSAITAFFNQLTEYASNRTRAHYYYSIGNHVCQCIQVVILFSFVKLDGHTWCRYTIETLCCAFLHLMCPGPLTRPCSFKLLNTCISFAFRGDHEVDTQSILNSAESFDEIQRVFRKRYGNKMSVEGPIHQSQKSSFFTHFRIGESGLQLTFFQIRFREDL